MSTITKINFISKDIDQVVDELNSDLQKGLSNKEAFIRIQRYGRNIFSPSLKLSTFRKILNHVREPLIIILLISSIVSIIMGRIFDGMGIFVAVLIATTISIIQEQKSDKAFETLSAEGENINVKVLRDGYKQFVLKSDISIGDIIFLEMGDKIPADGRIISCSDFKVDESMLTGESEPVSKHKMPINEEKISIAETKNMVYSGTLAVYGKAVVIITSTGDNTEMGKIAIQLKEQGDQTTPLQEKLADLGKKISIIGIVAALFIFVFELYDMYKTKTMNISAIRDAFVVSVALIVAAVPEGLPTMIALTLAFNMHKMAKNNALVRKLIACETIGSVNIICSDKTGTLTQNKMTVVDVWCNGQTQQINDIRCQRLIDNMCINSTADINIANGNFEFVGNATECALLVSAHKNSIDYKAVRDSVVKIIREFHFTSDRKMMSTVVSGTVYSKGSPEKILNKCSGILIEDKVYNITIEKQRELEILIQQLQNQSKRIIAFAYKDMYDSDDEINCEDINIVENNLIFTGFIAIEDPLRPDVKDAIYRCKNAGVGVKILTGDNIVTAKSIANQLGILDDKSLILEVTEIENMDDNELSDILDRLVVLARSNPSAKMRIVKLLKERNSSVLVTGDGINDAPALRAADVGVAMGITGTEVSKEAADIVLLDDSFSTIVKAIKWGRGIYENFQRFLQFQLTVNVVAFCTAFIAEACNLGMPFTTLQLLWVNIIMDGPPALSLGLEPPRENLLDRKPVFRNSSIITKDMLFRIISNGIFIVCLLILLIKTHLLGGTQRQQPSIIFTAFVLFQLWNSFNCREFGTTSVFKYIHKNKIMIMIIITTFILQVMVTQFGGEIFNTSPLSLEIWGKIILFTFSVVVFNELIKLIKRITVNITRRMKF